jgi:hypothetical protein
LLARAFFRLVGFAARRLLLLEKDASVSIGATWLMSTFDKIIVAVSSLFMLGFVLYQFIRNPSGSSVVYNCLLLAHTAALVACATMYLQIANRVFELQTAVLEWVPRRVVCSAASSSHDSFSCEAYLEVKAVSDKIAECAYWFLHAGIADVSLFLLLSLLSLVKSTPSLGDVARFLFFSWCGIVSLKYFVTANGRFWDICDSMLVQMRGRVTEIVAARHYMTYVPIQMEVFGMAITQPLLTGYCGAALSALIISVLPTIQEWVNAGMCEGRGCFAAVFRCSALISILFVFFMQACFKRFPTKSEQLELAFVLICAWARKK